MGGADAADQTYAPVSMLGAGNLNVMKSHDMLGLRNAHKGGLSKIKSTSYIASKYQKQDGRVDIAPALKFKGQPIVIPAGRNAPIPVIHSTSHASVAKKLDSRRLKSNINSTRGGTGITSPTNHN